MNPAKKLKKSVCSPSTLKSIVICQFWSVTLHFETASKNSAFDANLRRSKISLIAAPIAPPIEPVIAPMPAPGKAPTPPATIETTR